MPSIASIEPKKMACETGALPRALLRWFTLAPNVSQTMSRAGRAATTAAAKTSVIILGGERGSSRKMWWISFSAA